MFLDRRPPALLYRVVGGLLGDPALVDLGYTFVQLRYRDSAVDESLAAIRLRVQELVLLEDLLSAS